MNENDSKFPLFIPPILRFIVELLTWIWVLLAGYWYVTIISIASFSIINFKGDKRPPEMGGPGIEVPGIVRVGLEIIWGIVGIYAANSVSTKFGLLQLFLFFIYVFFDYGRWQWMLGFQDHPPKHVIFTHSKFKKKYLR